MDRDEPAKRRDYICNSGHALACARMRFGDDDGVDDKPMAAIDELIDSAQQSMMECQKSRRAKGSQDDLKGGGGAK